MKLIIGFLLTKVRVLFTLLVMLSMCLFQRNSWVSSSEIFGRIHRSQRFSMEDIT